MRVGLSACESRAIEMMSSEIASLPTDKRRSNNVIVAAKPLEVRAR